MSISLALTAVVLGSGLASCGGAPPVTAHPEPAPDGKPLAQESPPSGPLVQEASAPSAAPDNGMAPGPGSSGEGAPRRATGVVQISTPVVKGKLAGQESVERVIRSTQGGLEACYERGLQNVPAAAGVVEFRINVTDSGAIKRVESANPSTMPSSVTTCMVGRFGALSFNAAGASTIDLKVTCQRAE